MNDSAFEEGSEISLFALGTILLRQWRRIALWIFVVGVVAALSVVSKPAQYRASASFIPQGADVSRSGLAGLAGQFGVALPSGNQTTSPDFYAALIKSRILLLRVAYDTLVVPELNERKMPVFDLLEIEQGPANRREDDALKALTQMVSSSVSKTTGVVNVAVETKWPSVSLAIVKSLLRGVDDYNQRTRQGQAAAEARFIEGRLEIAGRELHAAEDHLAGFLKTNRQIGSSPELTFERDRLQRDVDQKQGVVTSLTQAHEDAKIREVRDTPVTSVFEAPSVPALPEPRGRLKRVFIGFLLGGTAASLGTIGAAIVARRRREGNAEAEEFVDALRDTTRDISRARWFRARKQS